MAGSGGSGELGDPGDPPEDGELPCDLDGEAFTSTMVADHASHSSKRLRRDSLWFPAGPRTLTEVLGYNTSLAEHLLDIAPSLGQNTAKGLQQMVQTNVVVTSSYSGTGCFEGALHEIMSCLRGRFPGPSASLTSYSATEVDAAAQAVLKAHKAGIQHIFGDIQDRLPNATRKKLMELQAVSLQEYKYLQEELSLGQITKDEFMAAKAKMDTAYVGKLKTELSQVEFNETAWCIVRQQECYISPRHEKQHEKSYWVEASGNTCCPWSGMSSGNGWLDRATLPFLTWAYSTRYYEPDTILQENVARFPEAELVSIIGDFRPGVIKDLKTRPLVKEEEGADKRKYCLQVQQFTPTQLGIPSQRWRKYTSLHLQPWVASEFGVSFENLCFRQVQVDASIYFDSTPADERDAELEARTRDREHSLGHQARRRQDLSLTGNPDIDALSTSMFARLESWQAWSMKSPGLRDAQGQWLPPEPNLALVNITQNPGFGGTVQMKFMPCLLTHTLLFDLKKNQLVTVFVHWLAQGFAHPAALGVPTRVTRHFPFDHRLLALGEAGALSPAAQRRLAGNAMHWSAIGSWMLFNFSSTCKGFILRHQS